jgi:hypothetical protein
MAVYVDDMNESIMGSYKIAQMCHMLADTDDELHAMADKIGLDRRWWQSPDKASGSHYDIPSASRTLAVQHGAIEISMQQAAAMNTRRRVTGNLGVPDDAIEWLLTAFRENAL